VKPEQFQLLMMAVGPVATELLAKFAELAALAAGSGFRIRTKAES
jgi:hypothetical protein